MKASFKDRSIVLVLLLVFALVVSALLYFAFAKPKATGMITGAVQMVKVDNLQLMGTYNKYKTTYAIKLQENGKFYLSYYGYQNNQPKESKFEITSEQYNKLSEEKQYWFRVEFAKKDDPTKGIVKEIFEYDPMRR